MSQATRSKFRCIQISSFADTQAKQIKFSPVNGEVPENREFWKHTPVGSIDITITNPNASNMFQTGAEYFVDFSVATSD